MPLRLPKMLDVEVKHPSSPKWDLPATIESQLVEQGIRVKPGSRIAVAVGSRGIAHLREIVSAVITILREKGALPFIVPSMGSHGGATPAGQTKVLAEYGITQESMGVAIDARMDARSIGTTEDGVKVFFSEAAFEADGIVVINRIKPHTDFQGSIGSGILKMLAIGISKHQGALAVHAAASRLGHERIIRTAAQLVLDRTPILCAVAIIEDQHHETAEIRVLAPQAIAEEEEKLFLKSKALMPKLPFEEIDLLIVDFMGKNLSGTGMDPNVINRSVYGYPSSLLAREGDAPQIYRLFVRDLTDATKGNALGIGLADFTTTRAINKINLQTTYTNSLTALTPFTAKLPIYFDTDRECIERAIISLALSDSATPRIVRISSTLAINKLRVSETYREEIGRHPSLAISGSAPDWDFDDAGNLFPLESVPVY